MLKKIKIVFVLFVIVLSSCNNDNLKIDNEEVNVETGSRSFNVIESSDKYILIDQHFDHITAETIYHYIRVTWGIISVGGGFQNFARVNTILSTLTEEQITPSAWNKGTFNIEQLTLEFKDKVGSNINVTYNKENYSSSTYTRILSKGELFAAGQNSDFTYLKITYNKRSYGFSTSKTIIPEQVTKPVDKPVLEWQASVTRGVFNHALNGDFSNSHSDTIINYTTWDGTIWTAMLDGNTFIHAPQGDFSRSHRGSELHYISWDGSKWIARINGTAFLHSPEGDPTTLYPDPTIKYVTWGGGKWAASVSRDLFKHSLKGDDSISHYDEIINYTTWDGSKWTAKLDGNSFIHAPVGDFSRSHRDSILNYRTWDGSYWTVTINDNIFTHAPGGDFSRSHQSTIMHYMTWY